MKLKIKLILLINICILASIKAQTLVNTSFESADNYVMGTIHNQNKWTVTAGTGAVVDASEYIFEGSRALKLAATATTLQVDRIDFSSNTSALAGDVYIDFKIKQRSLPTTNFAITGYDLGTNTHRSFMIEFLSTAKIKIYDGSSGWATSPAYNADSRTRISVRIDNNTAKYQLAINGIVYDKLFAFREIKNSATSFDYHAIRFSLSSGTCDAALDNLYIGSAPIADISFPTSNPLTQSTITITQPVGATISLIPQQSSYENGTSVKAQLTTQSGYQFNGWTGSLSGTNNPVTFTINNNMTIGAIVAETTSSSTKRIVSNVTQLKEAFSAINPGDTVLVLDGTYNLGSIKINRGGTLLKPILIKSANLHGAKITGASTVTLSGLSYVTFEGFDIDIQSMSTIFKMEGCSNVRITRNWLKMKTLTSSQTSKWITVGDVWENETCNSHHNRFDHNLFDGKYDSGAWLVIDGSHGTVPAISQHDRIDHNIFRNNTPRLANEKETVRIGVSDLCKLDAFTVVESNLFEDCDGDPEIVSVKSCKDTVRNNTFRRCAGTVCLRQGNNSVVEGNFFFGEGKTTTFDGNSIGCGGVRVYGLNHKIYNNYFEGLTGSKWDAACTLTNGDVTNSSSSNSSHFLPENIVFAYNTLINNKSDLEIGFNNNGEYGLAPKNCSIANNIIQNDTNPIVKSFSTTSLAGVTFTTNIAYATCTSNLGISGTTDNQFKSINPQLVRTKFRTPENTLTETPTQIYKLSANSPAINASNGSFTLNYDAEGQPASGIRDIGADEFNPDAIIINGPLNEKHVGPTAPEEFQYEQNTTAIKCVVNETNFVISPNPFKGITKLSLPSEISGDFLIQLYNCTGQQIGYKQINRIENSQFIYIETSYKGLILCKITNGNFKFSFKLISE